MLTLVNTNRMTPPIAPIGLDYLGDAARAAGHSVEVLDLALDDDPDAAILAYFRRSAPELVGLTFRNVDDCFWPSGRSFLPELQGLVATLRRHTEAPLVLGGVGYSIFPERILNEVGADFGVVGDGEQGLPALLEELRGARRYERVPGLVYRVNSQVRRNRPCWPERPEVISRRRLIDNPTYFARGGQIGIETKRGCPRKCIYCADPVAKGAAHRLRDPANTVPEIESLLAQGIDVFHLCDPEFNLPPEHAEQVCDAWIRQGLGKRVRWYAYLAVQPLPSRLVERMRRAGCVGINFTSDAAHPSMLAVYRQPHRQQDLAHAVRTCREHGIATMLDMLLGGPGETPETVESTIRFFQQLDPDCAGAAVGVRIFPGTEMAERARREGLGGVNPNIRCPYAGELDLLRPTFYVSAALGPHPTRLVRELIGGDPRFFPPLEEQPGDSPAARGDHNYSDNRALSEAIEAGARGAYWDILRRLPRGGQG